MEATVELVVAGDPWPRHLMPDATLTVLHPFRWTNPDDDVPLPSQSKDPASGLISMCITHLGARGSFFPDFVFPFETAGGEFLDYLRRIKVLVPVPLSATHFRLLTPTPNGRLVSRLFDTSEIARVLGKEPR